MISKYFKHILESLSVCSIISSSWNVNFSVGADSLSWWFVIYYCELNFSRGSFGRLMCLDCKTNITGSGVTLPSKTLKLCSHFWPGPLSGSSKEFTTDVCVSESCTPQVTTCAFEVISPAFGTGACPERHPFPWIRTFTFHIFRFLLSGLLANQHFYPSIFLPS